MKIFAYIKKHPARFLIISLSVLCVIYLSHIVYRKYLLNNWYDRYIDRGQSGLRVFYYPNEECDGAFVKTEVVKALTQPSPLDKKFKRLHFSLRAVGAFSPPKSGHYKFFLRSDDGSRLYVDQRLIIDNWGIHPSEERIKTIPLKRGRHLVVIEYFQALGKADLDFGWLETGETKRSNNLDSFFHPISSKFEWDKDIKRFQRLIRIPYDAYILLSSIVISIWFSLRFHEKICLFIAKIKRHEVLSIVFLLIIILVINFYPIFFKGKTLASYPGGSHVQDPGGPYWEIEPYLYLNHYYYFNIKTIPLWNPYEGTGFPLGAVMNCGSFSPLGFLSSLYPSHLTMDFIMLFRLFLAGFFMYLFLKKIRINSFAAAIGGVYFMLAPPHIACINQFQMDTVVFLPLILYFLEKVLQNSHWKNWIFVSVFVGLAVLGGNPEEIFLETALIILYFFIRLFHINGSKIMYFKNFLIVIIIGLSLSAFFILPAFEFYRNSQVVPERCYGRGIDLNFTNLINIIFPPKIPQIPPSAFHIGIIPILVSLITIFRFKNIDRLGKGYVIFSLLYLFYFLSMLFNNSLANWVKGLPIVSHIWWGKYTSTFYIAIIVVMGMGFNVLMKSKSIISRGICVSIGFLFLINLYILIPREYPARAKSLPNPGAITFLKKLYEKTPFRVHPVGGGHILEPNRNCIYQLPISDHSGILACKRYVDFVRFIALRGGPFKSLRRYLDLVGVKYTYSNRGPMFEDGLRLVYNEGADYIYENKRAFPRAFIVHRAKYLPSDEILEEMASPNFDLKHNVIIEEDLPSEMLNCKGAPVEDNSKAEILKYLPHRISIKANVENNGFLVLTDTYYPGWKVYVDGKRSKIYLTDYLVRSVYLERGEYIVEFIYRPFSFLLGATISFITLIYLIIVLFLPLRNYVYSK